MIRPFSVRSLVLIRGLLLAALLGHTNASAAGGNVEVELLSEQTAVSSGRPFYVGVRM
jgi:hypothetical protein